MTKPNNKESLTALLNQFLQPKGITTTALIKDGCLKVFLSSAEVPKPQDIVPFILLEVISLGIPSISKIKIYGQQEKSFDVAWQQEFPIESQIDSPASAASPNVKTEAQISHSVSESEFRDALEQCSVTAKRAYQKSLGYYNQVSVILQSLKKSLTQTVSQVLSDKDANNFDFASVLENIVAEIERQAIEGLKDLEKSLNLKSQHLEDFTIVLFGRTKAGKSTICEALTRGDGSTMGTGSQRTTRDIREYRWKGLRLIDTPGIEAYKGDEDRQKALEVAYESDMVIFVASDDAVQPSEFEGMALLKEKTNKYFFVLFNIKNDIETQRKLERFIRHPEKIFEPQRLAEHKKHISNYVKDILEIEQIDISCIHAFAAFLSTQPQYAEYSQKLLESSRIEEAYNRITLEIKTTGSQRRWNSFFDAVIYFIDSIEKMIDTHQRSLSTEAEFMGEKQKELEKIFKEHTERGKVKIERKCNELFNRIKEWIPNFVDEYLGKDSAQSEYQRRMDREKKKIEDTMNGLLEEIVNDLVSSLSEFQKQYQYDMGAIKLELLDLGSFQEWQVGKVLKWVGVGLGAASAIAFGIGTFATVNFWNPVGWVAGITSMAVGFSSWVFGNEEKKAWLKKQQEAKDCLWNSIDKSKQETFRAYEKLLYKNITHKAQKEVLEQVKTYSRGLNKITEDLSNYVEIFNKLKIQIKNECT